MSRGQGGEYAARLTPYVKAAARQANLRAAAEKPWFPGLMLRVALDASAIRARVEPQLEAALEQVAQGAQRVQPPPLDEQFSPQVVKKPGEVVEIELSVYNWTERELRGVVAPVVPDGWKVADAAFPYRVGPTRFARFTTRATVPQDAAAGGYPIGARTEHRGLEQREIHTHRVQVAR